MKIFSKLRWYWDNHPQLTALAIGALTFLATAALSDVVGSLFSGWLTKVLIPWMKLSVSVTNFLLMIGALVFLAVGVLVTNFVIKQKTDYERPTISTHNALGLAASYYQLSSFYRLTKKIDDLLRESLENGADEKALENFVDQFYISIFQHFGVNVLKGGGILLPHIVDTDWLHFWRSAPDTVLSKKHFYIGAKKSREFNKLRGSSGRVYTENKPRVIRIINREKGIANDPDFRYFDSDHKRAEIPYSAFLAIPIHFREKVVGVLTVESNEPDTFTDENIEYFQTLVDKVGDALVFHGKIVIDSADRMEIIK